MKALFVPLWNNKDIVIFLNILKWKEEKLMTLSML